MVECWEWRGLQWSGGNHFVIPRSWAAVVLLLTPKFPFWMMMERRSVSIELCPALYFGWGFDDNQLQSQHTSSYLTPSTSYPDPDTSDRSVPGKNRVSWRKYLECIVPLSLQTTPIHCCVELCVSAEVHHTAHSSGSLDTCLRQKIVQSSVSLHVNSQDSGVTIKVLLSTWPQFISNNITTSLQSNNS